MFPANLAVGDDGCTQTESFARLSRDWYLATSLYDAIDDADIRQVTILLVEKYACCNIIIPEYGISPLHLAVGHHCESFGKEVVRLILRNGGNPNIKADDDITPIHIASAWNRPAIVRLLLSYGADPWQLDDKEKNAFHYAYEQQAWDSMKALDAFRKIENVDFDGRNLSNCEYSLDKVIVYGKDVQAEYKAMVTSPKLVCSMHSEDRRKQFVFGAAQGERGTDELVDTCSSLKVDDQFDLCKSMQEEDLLSDVNKSKILSHRKGQLYEFCPSHESKLNENDDTANSIRDLLNDNIWDNSVSRCKRMLLSKMDKINNDHHPGHSTMSSAVMVHDENDENIADKSVLISEDSSGTDANGADEMKKGHLVSMISEDSFRRRGNVSNNNDTKAGCVSLMSEEENDGKHTAVNREHSTSSTAQCGPLLESHLADEVQDEYPEDEDDGGDADDFVSLENDKVSSNSSVATEVEMCNNGKSCLNPSLRSVKGYDDENTVDNKYSSDLLTEEDESEKDSKEFGPLYKGHRGREDNNWSSSYYSCPELEHARAKCDCRMDSSASECVQDSSELSEKATDVRHRTSNEANNNSHAEEKCRKQDDRPLLVSEQYKYTDDEEGVVLIEKRLPGRPMPGKDIEDGFAHIESKKNYSSNAKNEKFSEMTDANEEDVLKTELKSSGGFNSNLITKGVKRLYLRNVKRFRKNPLPIINLPLRPSQFGSQLELILSEEDNWKQILSEWSYLESEMVDYFFKHSVGKKLAGGTVTTSFTYLLLDPTVTCNLPMRYDQIGLKETWHTFLKSIFYIGKGKNQRPYSHLYEAFGIWNRGGVSLAGNCNMKAKHILEIWKSGLGVVSLHVFQNITCAEALTREAAMMDAVGLARLKNERNGVYYGNVVNWSRRHKQRLGVYLLYRAMMVLLADGERQLKPNAID